ncbi:MAG: hypothetical protein KDA89_13830, partial [Planctomycetaceae bacterium]|nr:hypothetical protein [Planctomycetaceae bacterium]
VLLYDLSDFSPWIASQPELHRKTCLERSHALCNSTRSCLSAWNHMADGDQRDDHSSIRDRRSV